MGNVDIEHLRGGHLDFDPGCTTCTPMTMGGRQHRRQDDRETAGAGRSLCGSHWKVANGPQVVRIFVSWRCAERHVSVSSKHWRINAARRSRMRLRGVWRFHGDEGRQFRVAVDD